MRSGKRVSRAGVIRIRIVRNVEAASSPSHLVAFARRALSRSKVGSKVHSNHQKAMASGAEVKMYCLEFPKYWICLLDSGLATLLNCQMVEACEACPPQQQRSRTNHLLASLLQSDIILFLPSLTVHILRSMHNQQKRLCYLTACISCHQPCWLRGQIAICSPTLVGSSIGIIGGAECAMQSGCDSPGCTPGARPGNRTAVGRDSEAAAFAFVRSTFRCIHKVTPWQNLARIALVVGQP